MIALWQPLLAVLLTLAPSSGDPESHEQARARKTLIAQAVAEASRGDSEMALAIIATWYEETRLDSRIHKSNAHSKWSSDGGLARCLGQIHQSRRYHGPRWLALVGDSYEATLRCAEATRWILSSARVRCRGDWAGAFHGYGTGSRTCEPGDRALRKLVRMRALRRAWWKASAEREAR